MARPHRPKRTTVDRRLPAPGTRQFPRTARVNEVLREVLAETIERLADTDDRLALVTVTAVTSDPDLRHASVLFATLDEPAHAALAEHRPRLQAAVAGEVRLRRTPKLAFAVDPAVSTGDRIEEILRRLHEGGHGGQAE